MSNLTRRILESIDYEKVANERRLNYHHLETKLQKTSDIQLERNERAVPMCYPYVTSNYNLKSHLINNDIYIPTYWPNVYEWTSPDEYERYLYDSLVALPIDQRYNTNDMDIILRKIDECRN